MRNTKSSSGPEGWIWAAALLVWMGAVSLACLLPSEDFPDATPDLPHLDKAAHFTFYLIAMLLAGKALRERGHPLTPANLWKVFALLFLYGLGIEALQAWLPGGRSAEWTDVLANAIGLSIGLASLKRLFHEV